MNHTFKRILAFALCLCCVFSIAVMPAYAATPSHYPIAQGVDFSRCRGQRQEFTIRGNLFTRKMITISLYNSIPKITGREHFDIEKYVKGYANFGYIIYNQSGKIVAVDGNLRIGDRIYLPRGRQNYRVVILSTFDSYRGLTTAQLNALCRTSYYLQY